jgi:hypothetical protein
MKPGLFASVSLVALGVLAPVSGCSISGEAFSAPNATSVVHNPYGPDGGAADAAIIQGSSSGSGGASDAAMSGNPLCRMAQADDDGGLYGCNPDMPATSIDCAMDGGAAAGDGGGYACRVQPVSSSGGMNSPAMPATGCSPSSGDAVTGECKVSNDCAPSYDCVGTAGTTASTTGACRHYCCAGNSVCEQLPDGASLFCDVQFLKEASATPVPVCMPIFACDLQEQLTQPGHACNSDTQTCSVVREDGKTGCVDIGPQGPMDSCDVAHCQEGLVCLGAPGQRLCYQLCDTQSNSCTAPETCQGGLPLFQDPRVGVCRQ